MISMHMAIGYGSILCAFITGCGMGSLICFRITKMRIAMRLHSRAQVGRSDRFYSSGSARLLVGWMCKGGGYDCQSLSARSTYSEQNCSQTTSSARHETFSRAIAVAGLNNVAHETTACALRLRLACGGIIVGSLFGGILGSVEMMVAGATCCAFVGWRSIIWSLKQEGEACRMEIERLLPSMAEVLCMGLRAGLTFDQAIDVYCRQFDGLLSIEMRHARRQWDRGLCTRDQALKACGQERNSVILQHSMNAIVRSLRFGSPLADVLESLASEARRVHASRIEERVSKAPIKIIMPVGLLILPSMLLLVLGPVLLDLLDGLR
ncbi:MAG: type II secretion system F family protein [Eggerthellaceae bacterium]|nr:type II secretion system F family protein [Eggerthellaceae bacterium]